ncbi:MAG: PIN domain-containing protein [Acidimicrobiia bacterium]
MTAVDTSVVVPALATWHEAHEPSRHAASGASIPAHALLESYAVLTRLPAPHRLDSSTASELLGRWFPPSRILELDRAQTGSLLARLAAAGVDGGSAYDGIIALTTAAHDETLLTRDARASATYERLGVPYRLVD